MEVLIKDGIRYNEFEFKYEEEFEKIIFDKYKYFFGENSILFLKKKIKTQTNIGTIPDGFLINILNKKWHIIEVELSTHDVYRHILPQITKFASALNNPVTKKTLIDFFEQEVKSDLNKLAKFISHNIHDIYKEIVLILNNPPELLIILDRQHRELQSAIDSLPFNSKVKIIRTFVREKYGIGDNIFLFDSEEDNIPIMKNDKLKDNVLTSKTIKPTIKKFDAINKASEKVQFFFWELDEYLNNFENIIVKENTKMLSYCLGSAKRGNSIAWLQPNSSSITIYLTKNGVYKTRNKNFVYNSSKIPSITFKESVFEDNIEYIKDILKAAYDYRMNK